MRYLKANEFPNIGDVFKVFDGSFNTAIVTKIDDSSCHVERPKMECSGPFGTPNLSVERFVIDINRLREYPFYGEKKIENHWFWRG